VGNCCDGPINTEDLDKVLGFDCSSAQQCSLSPHLEYPCMRLASSPCISTLVDASSTPSTARSWTGLTRARKPVSTADPPRVHPAPQCPCAHARKKFHTRCGPTAQTHSTPQTGRACALHLFCLVPCPAAAPVRSVTLLSSSSTGCGDSSPIGPENLLKILGAFSMPTGFLGATTLSS
jgi:hypothetical protein